MKYYCVTTTISDRGTVTANVTSTVEADNRPEDSFTSTSRRDIYNDWFDSLEEALEFVEDAKMA
ncbi:hypothetical protein D3Z38_08920 [Clostridiales bacterium]|nr:hypothetical protein [Clostridiales bacterium]